MRSRAVDAVAVAAAVAAARTADDAAAVAAAAAAVAVERRERLPPPRPLLPVTTWRGVRKVSPKGRRISPAAAP